MVTGDGSVYFPSAACLKDALDHLAFTMWQEAGYEFFSLESEHVCILAFQGFLNFVLLLPLPSSLSLSPSLSLPIYIHKYFHHSGPLWSLLCMREVQYAQ